MGLLRFFLALSVIGAHANSTVLGYYGIRGQYVVDFFFIISGFYMAMVLNGRYKDTDPLHFYLNRVLRLFPTYYIGLIFALLISYHEIANFFGQLDFGAKLYFIFQNLFIIGQDASYLVCAHQAIATQGCADPVGMAINPPMWSLAVECCFFLAAPFILKSEKRTYLMVLAGCIYSTALHRIVFPLEGIEGLRNTEAYALNMYFYPASFIFFGGGALAFHLSKRTTAPNYIALAFLVLALSYSYTVMPAWHMLLIATMIPVLFNYTKKNKFDRALGDLTYPAYILHFPFVVLLEPVAKAHPEYFRFVSMGTVVAAIAVLLGHLIHITVENRVNAYRKSFALKAAEREVLGNVNPTPWPRYAPVVLALYLLVPAPMLFYIFKSQTEQRHISWVDALRHSPRPHGVPVDADKLGPAPAEEEAAAN
ncbi:acyltransferase family protein [Amantichitinum ursilacus]|uniref:Acyltransferase family protein n=1 Tax=Amantichitinum ursilacus TaxID=857265 RepID=A0A0N0XG22_9NEIS|nr:acyltransferase [Amantichitinum ursilacus]KPC49361.1 Acyltransferase family protein [Amantichitinum ursilacus]